MDKRNAKSFFYTLQFKKSKGWDLHVLVLDSNPRIAIDGFVTTRYTHGRCSLQISTPLEL